MNNNTPVINAKRKFDHGESNVDTMDESIVSFQYKETIIQMDEQSFNKIVMNEILSHFLQNEEFKEKLLKSYHVLEIMSKLIDNDDVSEPDDR